MLTCMRACAQHTCTRTHRHVHAHTHTPHPSGPIEGGRTTKRNSHRLRLGWVYHECGLFKSTQAMLRRGHVYPRVRGRRHVGGDLTRAKTRARLTHAWGGRMDLTEAAGQLRRGTHPGRTDGSQWSFVGNGQPLKGLKRAGQICAPGQNRNLFALHR